MNLETTKKAANLYRDYRKIEDKITFFTQFIPQKPNDRIFSFTKGKPPQLEIVTTDGDNWAYFPMDEETTLFVIHALEVKRGRLLKEIDAL